jgi:putative spermidine/putrescine transport system permease protein
VKTINRNITSAALVISVLMPFTVLIIWSFSTRWFYPQLWPEQWGLRAWQYIFGTAGSQIIAGLIQSMLVALATAAISIVIGVPAGRALGLYDFKAKDTISVMLMLPVIVPPLCVAMGLQLWFIKLGLAETFIGVVLVHLTFCLPYSIFVMWGVFSNYDPDYENQARSLGANSWEIITRVMLPLTLPGIMVAGLYSFLLSWSQYLSTLIIGGGRITTLPILLFALMGSGDRPVAAAVSMVFVAPAFLALLFSARYLGGKSIAGVR